MFLREKDQSSFPVQFEHFPAYCAHLSGHIVHSACKVRPLVSSGGDLAYAVFSLAHGRRHSSVADYRQRLTSFQRSVGLIATHNARKEKSYSLALNKFADWTEVWDLLEDVCNTASFHSSMRNTYFSGLPGCTNTHIFSCTAALKAQQLQYLLSIRAM